MCREVAMFKKIYLLTFLLLIAISSVCFADDGRWYLVAGSEAGTTEKYLDTSRVIVGKYKGDNYIDCWSKLNLADEDVTFIIHTYIHVKDMMYKEKEISIYKHGNYEMNIDKSKDGWKNPTPDSINEIAIKEIINWVTNNKNKVTINE